MATIDDLQSQGAIQAISEETDTSSGLVDSARFIISLPRALLDSISGDDTASRVLVRDWLKTAIDSVT